MKIAIYSPYLDTAGGGEKYILTIAEILSEANQVDVLLDTHLSKIGKDKIIGKITSLHGIDLSKVNFVDAPLGKQGDFLKRMSFLRNYDWLFYLTDGSIFYSTTKNSVLHFQVPFTNAPKSLWGKLKLGTWKLAIFNSDFTRSFVEKYWNIKGLTIYPPVDIDHLKLLKKKKQIITVGRFFGYLKDKKHEVLIKAFKQLKEQEGKDWSLHIVGAASEGDRPYLEELEELAAGEKIFLHPNASREEIIKLYGESQIYWHAMGYGENDPKKFEHFGIAVVEAMASGCVPVIIKLGGLTEIVEDEVSGLFWGNLPELEEKTLELMNNSKEMDSLSKAAIQRSQLFSKQHFAEKIKQLVK